MQHKLAWASNVSTYLKLKGLKDPQDGCKYLVRTNWNNVFSDMVTAFLHVCQQNMITSTRFAQLCHSLCCFSLSQFEPLLYSRLQEADTESKFKYLHCLHVIKYNYLYIYICLEVKPYTAYVRILIGFSANLFHALFVLLLGNCYLATNAV